MPGSTATRVGTPHPAADQVDEREPQPRQVRPDDDADPREGLELINAAARSEKGRDKLTSGEQTDALEWFLSDETEVVTDTIELNVRTRRNPNWIKWTIQAVDRDELRRIRRQSQQSGRRARITGNSDFDSDNANLQIVLLGTVYPDLRAAAKRLGLVDPADAVRRKFRMKPGLIDQIAGDIMSLSGYDDEDVREVEAARG